MREASLYFDPQHTRSGGCGGIALRVELPGQSFCSSIWWGRQLINLDYVASGKFWQDDDYRR
jgi:hypothetical protein